MISFAVSPPTGGGIKLSLVENSMGFTRRQEITVPVKTGIASLGDGLAVAIDEGYDLDDLQYHDLSSLITAAFRSVEKRGMVNAVLDDIFDLAGIDLLRMSVAEGS